MSTTSGSANGHGRGAQTGIDGDALTGGQGPGDLGADVAARPARDAQRGERTHKETEEEQVGAHGSLSGSGSLSSRGGSLAVTAELLGSIWPATSQRLAGQLRRRRLPACVVEEIVQEVAVRALGSGVECTSAEDLWPWASTVAHHLAVDHWRSTARIDPAEVPDVAERHSVEEIVESRLRYGATIEAIRSLSGADREHLAGLTREPTVLGPLPSRVKVGVHRARRRLLAALGEVGVAVGGWRFRLRPRRLPSAIALAAVVVVPVAFLLVTRAPTGGAETTGSTVSSTSASAPSHAPAVRDPQAKPPVSRTAPAFVEVRARPNTAVAAKATPEMTVPIRYPANLAPGKITVRPRRPGDHLVCVNKVPVIGQACAG